MSEPAMFWLAVRDIGCRGACGPTSQSAVRQRWSLGKNWRS